MGVVGVANFLACHAAQQIEGDKLNAIVDLVFNYPEFAIAVKRGNDRNLPLWLIGVFFAGSVLLDLFSVIGWAGTDDAPSTLAMIIAVPFTVARPRLVGRARFPQRHARSEPIRAGPAGEC